ncbi:hypothetical protein GH714_026441 [Hevea brasiliensis]|uniref:Cytochrome P450 n=1 Tax=Hevea brasiliensis TaxID=3981 RepID=A0A6A6NJ97_HEVBR|nr:hypothetical protein GH714_026441 [Hevea brasiliensis]
MIVELLLLFLLLIFSFLLFFFFTTGSSKSEKSISTHLPKSYPLIGSSFAIKANFDRRVQWTSDILQTIPSATFVLHRPLGLRQIFTGNPANVEHILKTHFQHYQKGPFTRHTLFDFLGNGIFNSDGDTWKFQRQVASHEFSTKSLRKFVETVVDTELSQRLIPILSDAAANRTVLDLQDILQRFAFDNICKIAFGYDPAYLSPSLPPAPFAEAFEESVRIISDRFNRSFPIIWKIKKFFHVGSEKRLKKTMSQVRDFAMNIVKGKKGELKQNSSLESVDLLSRFLSSGISDETFVTDIVISFILAGRDTTSAALNLVFLVTFEKPTVSDDVLPDGTALKKGTRVTYHPYAMGRLEVLWGPDWADFKPERWLQEADGVNNKRSFIGRDPYTYPVFQAGPRVCLGKEMAFLQMKRVVSGVLSRFKVVPAAEDGEEPVFIAYLTNKMKGGFPVTFEKRIAY